MAETKLPKPPVDANVDLRDFPFMPLDVARLRDSDLVSKATDAEFRAAVLLWCAAWHQVPAGSLPDDTQILTHLAGLGRDTEAFERVRGISMGHFQMSADGRLYHPVICEKVLEAWERKEDNADRREADRVRKREAREQKEHINQGSGPKDKDRTSDGSSGNSTGCPPEVRSKTGTGTGTGTEEEEAPPSPSELVGKAIGSAMIVIWNQDCVAAGLAKVLKLHQSRQTKLEVRLVEDFENDLGQWETYCRRIADSPFLTGKNDRNWKADLDWVLEPRNLAKIVEGKFDPDELAAGDLGWPYEDNITLQMDWWHLKRWIEVGHWNEFWGRNPDSPECSLSRQVLEKYGPGGPEEIKRIDK